MDFAILFDNDGTLVDSVPITLRATNEALAEEGFPPVSVNEVVEGMRRESIIRMMGHARVTDRETGERLTEAYYGRVAPLLKEVPLYTGLGALVRDLSDAGFRLGIVSNNHTKNVRTMLDSRGIGSYFPVVIGEDNTEETKPGPGGLLQACRNLEVIPARAIYVGDSLSDAKAARSAGVYSVGVRWNTYDPDGVDGLGFDKLVDAPEEILDVAGALSSDDTGRSG